MPSNLHGNQSCGCFSSSGIAVTDYCAAPLFCEPWEESLLPNALLPGVLGNSLDDFGNSSFHPDAGLDRTGPLFPESDASMGPPNPFEPPISFQNLNYSKLPFVTSGFCGTSGPSNLYDAPDNSSHPTATFEHSETASLGVSAQASSPQQLTTLSPSSDSITFTPPLSTESSVGAASQESTHANLGTSRVRKRQLNTLAARRYRQKRVDQVSELEAALKESEREKDALKVRVARLEGEVEILRDLVGRRG